MRAHSFEIQLWASEQRREIDGQPAQFVRWRCSCGKLGPALVLPPISGDPGQQLADWPKRRSAEHSARTGGQRHIAAMERGRDPFAVLPQPGKGGARTTEGNTREIAKHERRAAIARGVMRRGER